MKEVVNRNTHRFDYISNVTLRTSVIGRNKKPRADWKMCVRYYPVNRATLLLKMVTIPWEEQEDCSVDMARRFLKEEKREQSTQPHWIPETHTFTVERDILPPWSEEEGFTFRMTVLAGWHESCPLPRVPPGRQRGGVCPVFSKWVVGPLNVPQEEWIKLVIVQQGAGLYKQVHRDF